VKVRCDEGVANRIGPEPCAGVHVEGSTSGRDSASAHKARRGRRPWHVQTLLVSGNRESSRSTARSKAAGPRQGGEEP
jgi:hypothetical protein